MKTPDRNLPNMNKERGPRLGTVKSIHFTFFTLPKYLISRVCTTSHVKKKFLPTKNPKLKTKNSPHHPTSRTSLVYRDLQFFPFVFSNLAKLETDVDTRDSRQDSHQPPPVPPHPIPYLPPYPLSSRPAPLTMLPMRMTGLLLGALLLPAAIMAENWPEWRGPRRDGTSAEKSLPLKWSATENVKWKAPLPAPGNSTPIVWGDQVFVTQAVEDGGKRLLISFDRKNGKVLWEKGTLHAGKEQSHDTNPQCSASPATDGERVIAWFGTPGIFCYDMDGKELWKRDLGRQSHEWGYASSPVIHKDLVYLNFGPGENSFLVALNKKTGEEVWRVDVEEKHYKERKDGFANQDNGYTGSWSTPILVNASGREDLVITVGDKMLGLDPLTGKQVWVCRGLNPLIYTSPVFGEGLILGNGGFHGPDMVVKPGGTGDVTETHKLWEGGRTANRLGSAVIKDGYFFLPTMPGLAECIELKTGKKIWDERIRGAGPKSDTWSSMVLVGDRIYVLNQSGDTIVLRASPKFEILQVNSIGNELSNSSIVASNGEWFIRTHKNLWCISNTPTTASK